MNVVLIAARGIHFASAMLLFGELFFALFVAWPALRGMGLAASDACARLAARSIAVAWWSLATSVASGIAWLAFEAMEMTGSPMGQALNPDTLALMRFL